MADLQDAVRRKMSFVQTIKAVGAAFFGVRGGRAHAQDIGRLNPVHLIIAGVLMAVLFVLALVMVVKLVLA